MKDKVFVIPCSGIGKVQGLMAREVAYALVDNHACGLADTICLALLVSGDKEAKQKLNGSDSITIDGCPKMCAYKNIELAGGKVVKSYRIVDAFKKNRGAQPGTATALAEDGWKIVEQVASELGAYVKSGKTD